jgi:hypothetical protein
LWLRRITSKAAGYSRRRCRSAYLLGAPGPEAYCSKKTLDEISYEGAMQQVADCSIRLPYRDLLIVFQAKLAAYLLRQRYHLTAAQSSQQPGPEYGQSATFARPTVQKLKVSRAWGGHSADGGLEKLGMSEYGRARKTE